MKRAFRAREQGKVKEVKCLAVATVPGTDQLERAWVQQDPVL